MVVESDVINLYLNQWTQNDTETQVKLLSNAIDINPEQISVVLTSPSTLRRKRALSSDISKRMLQLQITSTTKITNQITSLASDITAQNVGTAATNYMMDTGTNGFATQFFQQVNLSVNVTNSVIFSVIDHNAIVLGTSK